MRSHILYICTTYYQLILAIHMKHTVKHDCFIDVILTDNSREADNVVKNLNQNKIFHHSFYAAARHLDVPVRSVIQFASDVIKGSIGINKEFKHKLKETVYDEMIIYNQNMFAYMVYAYISRYNSHVTVSRYEEGITSYNLQYAMGKSARRQTLILIRKLLKKKILDDMVGRFYCMYPELYHGNLQIVLIPIFKRDKGFIEDINKTFGITEIPVIEEKYIFFATSHDYRSFRKMGEKDLMLNVAALLGKDNMIVKGHPRINLNDMKESGFKVLKYSAIPWEAVLLNESYSDHVFITTISGSLLSANIIWEKGAETIFLYPLLDIDCNDRALGMVESFEEMKKTYKVKGLSRIHTVYSWEELNECLRDL